MDFLVRSHLIRPFMAALEFYVPTLHSSLKSVSTLSLTFFSDLSV